MIDQVKEWLSKPGKVMRAEEVQTLNIMAWVTFGPRLGLTYTFPTVYEPMTLSDELGTLPRPSREQRRDIALRVADAVRSLHVHHQLQHPAIRCRSFVFLRHRHSREVLEKPFLLDWTQRPTANSMYRHPNYDPAKASLWVNQAYALLMVLSEIVAWQKITTQFDGNDAALKKGKSEMAAGLRRGVWKVFPWALERLVGRDAEYHEKCGHSEIKRFYDTLCENIATQSLTA
jgi:hypothetical protein